MSSFFESAGSPESSFPVKRRSLAGARCLVAILAVAGLSACSVPRIVNEYKIDVQQGNVLEQDAISQLRPGLTKDQVRFILGTPLLQDPFHADRWDYVYRLHRGASGEVETRRVAVFFEENKLVRVQGDVVPAQADQAVGSAAAAVPEAKVRVIDLGSLPPDAEVKLPPPDADRGFLGRMLDKIF